MVPLTDFIRSSYARLQAYLGQQAPPAPSASLPADSPNDDQTQFAQALALHQQGNLNDAEILYRALLLKYPGHFELLHRLGMVQGQRGNFAAAVAFIEQAIVIDPDNTAVHGSLGNCLKGLGKHEAALACYDRALALQPNDADTWSNRGATLRDLKRPEQALESYDRALAINPHHVLALDNRGTTLRELKRPEEALASHDKALAINPSYALAHYNRGLILAELKQLEAACVSFKHALALNPDNIDVLTSLGAVLGDMALYEEALGIYDRTLVLQPDYAEVLIKQGAALSALNRHEEALACFDKTLAVEPRHAIAHYNRAITLGELKRNDEALNSCDSALRLMPEFVEALNYRGSLLVIFNKKDEAITVFTRLLALKPDYAETHDNLSNVYRAQGLLADAEHHLRQAIKIKPELANFHYNLATLLKSQGKLYEAMEHFGKALKIKSDHHAARSVMLLLMQKTCKWDDLDSHIESLRHSVYTAAESSDNIVSPFLFMALPHTTPDEQKRCAEKWVQFEYQSLIALGQALAFDHGRPSGNKINIGYLSRDFRHHPVARLMAEVFELHNRDQFHITAYSYGPDDGSEMRKRLQRTFDQFVDIREISDSNAARRIYENHIDILVDLTGFTDNTRVGILALRPAPLQLSYLGYLGTIGANFVDYLIADRFIVPPEQQKHYTEKILYLPNCFQPNDSTRPRPPATPRTHCGLPENAFIFCSFNQTYKITPTVFDVWCRLLVAIPDSVLWLVASTPYSEANLKQEAEIRGVSPSRLVMAPLVETEEYLARMQCADLYLDTIPYNAGTTCSDALWMGLPVITCVGQTFSSRMAGSLLSAMGLPELITYNLEDYYRLALDLATNRKKLDAIQSKLIANRDSASLFDSARFTRDLEGAYLGIIGHSKVGLPHASTN